MRKNLKKLLFVLSSSIIVFLLIGKVSASYDLFLDQLKIMDIAVNDILDQDTMSRYELAKLLNAVECQDCIHAPSWMENRYTSPYWNDFIQQPGKDFDEIDYLGGLYNSSSYYYCVAYVGDNQYMRGYPESVSPVCAGMFCGAKSVTKGEFIQVIINLLSKYIFPGYDANWIDIYNWMLNIEVGSQEDGYLDRTDRTRISQKIVDCPDGSCQLKNGSEFKTYLKYCMFNIDACDMESFDNIKQAVWPVAELNILYKQKILDYNEVKKNDIHSPAKGSVVLETLYKLYNIVDCEFNDDYDCDTLDNAHDNCPNGYNPSQQDEDEDGIGDVCDDDIDGDGVLNPIGILDELGRLNIAVATTGMDNCLLTQNPDQARTEHPFIGDACFAEQDKVALYIAPGIIRNSAPATVSFDAITKGTVEKVERNMGDGTHLEGQQVSHYFENPGPYTISAVAHGPNNQAFAKVSLLLGENSANYHAIQIVSDKLGIYGANTIKFKADYDGQVDYFLWDFGDGKNPVKKIGTNIFNKFFENNGQYSVSVKAYLDGKIVGGAKMVVAVGQENQGIMIKSNKIQIPLGGSIRIQSNGYGFYTDEIKNIQREFGDGTIVSNKSTQISHQYNTAGPHLLSQRVFLKDGEILFSYMTIFVNNPDRSTSHSLQLTPRQLWLQKGEESSFSISPVGDSLGETQILSYQHLPFDVKRIFSPTGRPIDSEAENYQNAGLYYPKSSLIINQCQRLENQATVVVHGLDMCLEALLRGNLGDFHCDMDEDGIPDICDNDIDGDSVINLIGILTHENPDCSISGNNINFDILNTHLEGVCTLDNCPFTVNSDQTDVNINGVGDVCQAFIDDLDDNGDGGDLDDNDDNDGDGIPDDADQCPFLPEDFNGINDLDGCPEIGIELTCPPYGTFPGLPVSPCDYDNICESNENCRCQDCAEFDACNPCEGEDCDLNCDYDGICESNENCECEDCVDRGICLACGNGVADPGETCITCPEDMGECPPSDCEDVLCPGPCNSCPCQFADYANDLAPGDKVRARLYDLTRQFLYDNSPGVLIDGYIDFEWGLE